MKIFIFFQKLFSNHRPDRARKGVQPGVQVHRVVAQGRRPRDVQSEEQGVRQPQREEHAFARRS